MMDGGSRTIPLRVDQPSIPIPRTFVAVFSPSSNILAIVNNSLGGIAGNGTLRWRERKTTVVAPASCDVSAPSSVVSREATNALRIRPKTYEDLLFRLAVVDQAHEKILGGKAGKTVNTNPKMAGRRPAARNAAQHPRSNSELSATVKRKNSNRRRAKSSVKSRSANSQLPDYFLELQAINPLTAGLTPHTRLGWGGGDSDSSSQSSSGSSDDTFSTNSDSNSSGLFSRGSLKKADDDPDALAAQRANAMLSRFHDFSKEPVHNGGSNTANDIQNSHNNTQNDTSDVDSGGSSHKKSSGDARSRSLSRRRIRIPPHLATMAHIDRLPTVTSTSLLEGLDTITSTDPASSHQDGEVQRGGITTLAEDVTDVTTDMNTTSVLGLTGTTTDTQLSESLVSVMMAPAAIRETEAFAALSEDQKERHNLRFMVRVLWAICMAFQEQGDLLPAEHDRLNYLISTAGFEPEQYDAETRAALRALVPAVENKSVNKALRTFLDPIKSLDKPNLLSNISTFCQQVPTSQDTADLLYYLSYVFLGSHAQIADSGSQNLSARSTIMAIQFILQQLFVTTGDIAAPEATASCSRGTSRSPWHTTRSNYSRTTSETDDDLSSSGAGEAALLPDDLEYDHDVDLPPLADRPFIGVAVSLALCWIAEGVHEGAKLTSQTLQVANGFRNLLPSDRASEIVQKMIGYAPLTHKNALEQTPHIFAALAASTNGSHTVGNMLSAIGASVRLVSSVDTEIASSPSAALRADAVRRLRKYDNERMQTKQQVWDSHPLGRQMVRLAEKHALRTGDRDCLAAMHLGLRTAADGIDPSSCDHFENLWDLADNSVPYKVQGKEDEEVRRYFTTHCGKVQLGDVFTQQAVFSLSATALTQSGELVDAAGVRKHLQKSHVEAAAEESHWLVSDHGGLELIRACSYCGKVDKECSCLSQAVCLKCSVCELIVQGLASMCPFCGHGGHQAHLRAWFNDERECPTGCGCRCITAGLHFNQELKKTLPNDATHNDVEGKSDAAVSWQANQDSSRRHRGDLLDFGTDLEADAGIFGAFEFDPSLFGSGGNFDVPDNQSTSFPFEPAEAVLRQAHRAKPKHAQVLSAVPHFRASYFRQPAPHAQSQSLPAMPNSVDFAASLLDEEFHFGDGYFQDFV